MESNNPHPPPNPLEPAVNLEEPSNSDLLDQTVHPQQVPTWEDSAVTRAEKFERHGTAENGEQSSSKRRKLDPENEAPRPIRSERQKGIAPIKEEWVSSASTYKVVSLGYSGSLYKHPVVKKTEALRLRTTMPPKAPPT